MRYRDLLETITAYHGTPHDVEQFSLRYMGAGEGVQAYGWGIYLAADPDVAVQYARKLGGYDPEDRIGSTTAIRLDGKIISVKVPEYTLTPLQRAALHYWYADRDQNRAIREIEEMMDILKDKPDHPNYRMDAETLEVLKTVSLAGRVTEARGQFYTVEINREEDEFILWDFPMEQQSEIVKKAFGTLMGGDDPVYYTAAGQDFPLNDYPEGPERDVTLRTLQKMGGELSTRTKKFFAQNTGGSAYQNLARRYLAERNWAEQHRWNDAQRLASMALYKRGIAGIKYFDGASRKAREGTSNYVVFNPADIKITGKE